MPGHWDTEDHFAPAAERDAAAEEAHAGERSGDAVPSGIDRRALLLWASGASLGATGFFLFATGVQALLPPARSIDGFTEVGDVAVARLSDLEVGRPLFTEYGDHRILLIRTSGSRVVGFDAACPHARCTLLYNETTRRFDCPCHASSFTLDGRRQAGPARRDMTRLRLRLDADEVVITGFET